MEQRRRIGALVIAMSALVGVAAPAAAEAGDLDRGYGRRGIAVLPDNVDERVPDSLMLPNGAMVVLTSQFSSFPQTVSLTKLTPDGRLDTTFGTAGTSSVELSDLDLFPSTSGAALTRDKSGRFYLAGTVADGTGDPNIGYDGFVARFTANGAHDTSFGANGEPFIRFNDDTACVDARSIVASDGAVFVTPVMYTGVGRNGAAPRRGRGPLARFVGSEQAFRERMRAAEDGAFLWQRIWLSSSAFGLASAGASDGQVSPRDRSARWLTLFAGRHRSVAACGFPGTQSTRCRDRLVSRGPRTRRCPVVGLSPVEAHSSGRSSQTCRGRTRTPSTARDNRSR